MPNIKKQSSKMENQQTTIAKMQEPVNVRNVQFLYQVICANFTTFWNVFKNDDFKDRKYNLSNKQAQKTFFEATKSWCRDVIQSKKDGNPNGELEVHYKYAKGCTSGRHYPNQQRLSIQQMPTIMRSFVTQDVLYDYDLYFCHMSIFLSYCKEHFDEEEEYRCVTLLVEKRDKIMEKYGVTKNQINTWLNQDNPKITKKEQPKLFEYFKTIKDLKLTLYEKLKHIPKAVTNEKNPISSNINRHWCDREEEIVKMCIADKVCNVNMLDGFMSSEKYDCSKWDSRYGMRWVMKQPQIPDSLIIPVDWEYFEMPFQIPELWRSDDKEPNSYVVASQYVIGFIKYLGDSVTPNIIMMKSQNPVSMTPRLIEDCSVPMSHSEYITYLFSINPSKDEILKFCLQEVESSNKRKELINMLVDHSDISQYEVNKSMFAFDNGYFNIYDGTFTRFDKEPDKVYNWNARVTFPYNFKAKWLEDDMKDIEIPGLDDIFEYHLNEGEETDAVREMAYGGMGRLLYPLGYNDSWGVHLLLRGCAQSGKSQLVNIALACCHTYATVSVRESNYPLQNIAKNPDADIMIDADCVKDFINRIGEDNFKKIATLDTIPVAVKYATQTTDMIVRAPCMFVSNHDILDEMRGDEYGGRSLVLNINKRFIASDDKPKIEVGQEVINKYMDRYLIKVSKAYKICVEKYGKEQLRTCKNLPEYFKESMRGDERMSKLAKFLTKDSKYTKTDDCRDYVQFKEFAEAYKNFYKDDDFVSLKQKDTMLGEMGLKVEKLYKCKECDQFKPTKIVSLNKVCSCKGIRDNGGYCIIKGIKDNNPECVC